MLNSCQTIFHFTNIPAPDPCKQRGVYHKNKEKSHNQKEKQSKIGKHANLNLDIVNADVEIVTSVISMHCGYPATTETTNMIDAKES